MGQQFVIIGAGQLGSRHLQSLSEIDSKIWVFDPSLDSLEMSKKRLLEVDNKANVIFSNDMNEFPEAIDLAIVATNSDVRLMVIEQLLKKSKVKNIILEKVLFPKLEHYEIANKLFLQNNVKAWVNCPRRTWDVYKEIKSKRNFNIPISVSVHGGDFGLGSNTIHFLDLMNFLSPDEHLVECSTSCLSKEILKSKRANFIEYSGTLHFSYSNGSSFTINSVKDVTKLPLVLFISFGNNHFIIDETNKILVSHSDNLRTESKFEPLFQSKLTAREANLLLTTGKSDLINYETSSLMHQFYLKVLLNFVGKSLDDYCAIT